MPSSKEQLQQLASYETGKYQYSVGDFVENADFSSVKLSPSGNKIAFFAKDQEKKRAIFVKNLQTNEISVAAAEGKNIIDGFFWRGDEHIIYSMDNEGNERQQIFVAILQKNNTKKLTPFPHTSSTLLSILKADNEFIHIAIYGLKAKPSIFKMNIISGKFSHLINVKSNHLNICNINFDKNDDLRG